MIKMKPAHLKILIGVVVLMALMGALWVSPIPQDTHYHDFADQRTILGIPHFWNVVTNIGFAVVGGLGLWRLRQVGRLHIVFPIKVAYQIFFLAVALVAFGSGYYHLHPTNLTLIWDRIPMGLAFMALLSISVAEFLSVEWAGNLLWPALIVGVMSVLSWYLGELRGMGDLRPYVLVQFLPMILILLLLLCGHNVFDKATGFQWLFVAYVVAKLSEHYDLQIYQFTHQWMSGHAIKHMAAALGLYALLQSFEHRHVVSMPVE